MALSDHERQAIEHRISKIDRAILDIEAELREASDAPEGSAVLALVLMLKQREELKALLVGDAAA